MFASDRESARRRVQLDGLRAERPELQMEGPACRPTTSTGPYARLAAGLLPLVATFALCAYGCGVSAAQHAANGLEAAQATVEYDDCRVKAHDGGTFESFCACVREVDARHRIDGGPCQ